jgi:hypothetical protein
MGNAVRAPRLADIFQFFDQQGLDHMLFESADHLIEIDLRISQGHIKDVNCPIPLGGNLGPVNPDAKIHKYGGNFVEHADMVPGFHPDYGEWVVCRFFDMHSWDHSYFFLPACVTGARFQQVLQAGFL